MRCTQTAVLVLVAFGACYGLQSLFVLEPGPNRVKQSKTEQYASRDAQLGANNDAVINTVGAPTAKPISSTKITEALTNLINSAVTQKMEKVFRAATATATIAPSATPAATVVAPIFPHSWTQPPPIVLQDLRTISSVCFGGNSSYLLEFAGAASGADESVAEISTWDGSGVHKIRTAKRRAHPSLPLLSQPLVLTWFSCEGNLHHFFRETWSPLYLTLERLGAFKNPQTVLPIIAFGMCHPGSFIYPLKGSGNDDDRACKGDRYQLILDMLPIAKNFDRNCISWPADVVATPGAAPLQCFENAVVQFGGSPEPTPAALRFVLQNSLHFCSKFGFSESPNITLFAPVRILIQQRLHRRLLNADEMRDRIMTHPTLQAAVIVRIEVLDDKPLEYQLALAACYTEVLIGVHGAGLQWGVFMGNSPVLRPRGALIELSSPAFGQYYSGATYAPNRASMCLCNQEDVENKTTLKRFTKGYGLNAAQQAKYSDKRIGNMTSVLEEIVRIVDFVRIGGCSDFRPDCGEYKQKPPEF